MIPYILQKKYGFACAILGTDNVQDYQKVYSDYNVETIIVDKLLISGTYDIDNISFNFPNNINVDTNEIYSMYNYRNIKILVKNEDI